MTSKEHRLKNLDCYRNFAGAALFAVSTALFKDLFAKEANLELILAECIGVLILSGYFTILSARYSEIIEEIEEDEEKEKEKKNG